MPNAKDPSRKKGSFGPVRFSVSRNYIFPLSRRLMMLIGGAASALVLLYFLFSAFLMGDTFSSPGGLSANHARFESECAKCHKSVSGIVSSKCSTCHEKTNDKLGVYTYAAHYLYRSENPERIEAAHTKHMGSEGTCATCHPEHRGNSASITEVPDARCASCHEFNSFNSGHPEFEFARMKTPDDSTLLFTHVRHTKFVLEDLQKKTGSAYLEKACLYCHNPQPDGKSFKPLDFDLHCGSCHLTTSSTTPSLAIKNSADPAVPGVETLQMIQQRRGPGTSWAFYTNPNEFSLGGASKVTKSPVYHRDPWIMENLKQLRRMVSGDPGLSELLRAQPAGMSKTNREAYSEAIATLRGYVTGLRSRPEPEVQAELTTIDSLLKLAQGSASATGIMLPRGAFSSISAGQNLTQEQKTDCEDFALKLARPCLTCHIVQNAAILGVRSSQRSFMRAEFDHRAHVLDRRCVECHTEIPVERALVQKDTTGVALLDKSSTHNIPGIANCFECHTSGSASTACVTCHFMHPNKENRGNLMLTAENK